MAIDIIHGWVASVGILFVDGKVVEVLLEYKRFLVYCMHYLGLAYGQE